MKGKDFDMDSFKESGIADLLSQFLTQELSEACEPASEEDLYEEIVDNFFILIQELGIDKFNSFCFANCDYWREIIIDGKEYDLDEEFCHDDIQATEALCAIEALISDLENDNIETVMENTEKMINMRV